MAPRQRSSSEQRLQVFNLLAQGWAQRAIAAEVFGDERFYGRVHRLARQQQTEPSVAEFEAMSDEELTGYVEQRLGLPPADTEPAAAPAAVQTLGDGFEKETAELEAMLQRLKRLVAQDLIDERYRPGALTEIARVGLALHQRREFIRLRELTREP